MADSQADICNLALHHIGVSETISAITDNVPEADACELHYPTVLDKALAEYDWQFARRLVTLTTKTGTPPTPWGYQYEYPSVATMVKPIRIDDERTSRQARSRIPFTSYTNDSDERVLLCNIQDAKLWYTYRDTNVPNYPEWFVNFLAWRLAEKIAGPITKDKAIQRDVMNSAVVAKSEAISADAESDQEDPEPEASWVAFRDGDIFQSTGIDAADYLP